MKPFAVCALLFLFPLAAGAGQQPSTPTPTAPATPSSVDRQAEAYSNFILGHISQQDYEETGDQRYADQAIAYYQKALALDPDAATISLKMAETYAESQRTAEAIGTVQQVLKTHPNDLEAHRLLARIYVRMLGQVGMGQQNQTIQLAAQQYEAILKLAPGDKESALWLARLYRFENQPDKASAVLEQLLQHDPSYEPAIEQYTQLLLDEGHAQQAIARLSKVAEGAGSGRLYDLLGDAYAQIHDEAKAESAYRQATELEPDVPAHWRRLARTLFHEEKFDEAAKAYRHLTELDPTDPDSYLRLAEIEYQEQKFDLAEADIQRAKQLAPDSLEVVYNEALIAKAQGRYQDAVNVLSSTIADLQHDSSSQAANPRVFGILYGELGELYRRQGNFPAAIETFQKMGALGPSEANRSRLELVETYRENNQIDQAIATAQQGLAADPKDRRMKITYALLLGDKEQTDEAVKTLKTMLDGSATDRDLFLDLAQVELRGRRFAQAERDARTAETLSKAPEQKSEAWFLLGAIYERQKKWAPAEREFQKALAVDPNNAEVLNYYGYMLVEEGVRLDQATTLVKRALAVDAGNSAYLDSLGWAYYKQNRLADARHYLREAVERSPHDPTILGHLGDVYDRLGQTDLAVQTWQKALDEWGHVVPADYEPAKVKALRKKLSRARKQSRRKSATAAVTPH